MNSGMLPAKTLILAYARIRITAAGPLLNLTGFPFMHYSACDTDSLQKTEYKINFIYFFPFYLIADELPKTFCLRGCILTLPALFDKSLTTRDKFHLIFLTGITSNEEGIVCFIKYKLEQPPSRCLLGFLFQHI